MPDPSPPTTSLAQAHIETARLGLDAVTSAIYNTRIELNRLEARIPALLASDAEIRRLLVDWEHVQRDLMNFPDRDKLYGSETDPDLERRWSTLCLRERAVTGKLRAIAREMIYADARPAPVATLDAAEGTS